MNPNATDLATDPWARLLAAPESALADHPGSPKLRQADGFWLLRLDRPDEHNRLDPADVDALGAFFAARTADEPQALRALAIIGTGERTFSSGYTLGAIGTELDHRLEDMLDALEHLPCLTIAALSGSVYGGATDMALACDLRIGREGLRMFMPAARFGLHYYPGGLRRYLDRLGLGATAKLMLTGMTIESAEMLRIGFLTESVPAEDFHTRMGEILEAVAQTDPATVARMKANLLELLAGGSRAETQAVLEAMARAHVESRDSEELQRRLAARLGR